MLRKSRNFDILFLSIFTILITLHPYFLHGQMNLFEFGIYLPNINAVLDGLIPYRDFFHLRGPLEVYVPAFLMHLFGENVAVLESYFYIGTVAALIVCVFIAREIFQTRFVLFLFVPVLIGRTFPRAVFTNWGGMRYALGLLTILFAIYFFRRKKLLWIFLSGIFSSLALLTSIEIGVSSIVSVLFVCIFSWVFKFYDYKHSLRVICTYGLGLAVILIPFVAYLMMTQSLTAYVDMTYTVITNMTNVFPDYLFEPHPRNFIEALSAMNPFNPHFKHLTPAYCFLFFIAYMAFRFKRGSLKGGSLAVMLVAFYGLIMYVSAFRKIGAAQFEMALQPEKILLFFMLEHALFALLAQLDYFRKLKQRNITDQVKVFGIYFLIFAFFMSSLGYSIARFNHRFFAYQYVQAKITGQDTGRLMPMNNQETETLNIKRLAGLTVPAWQAEELKQLIQFFDENTQPDEPVFTFPEQGAYNFILDRPFIGRFPMVSFSWIGGVKWHKELFEDLKRANPQYVIFPKVPDATLEKVYFKIQQNKNNYYQIWNHIMENYQLINSTQTLFIYQHKGGAAKDS